MKMFYTLETDIARKQYQIPKCNKVLYIVFYYQLLYLYSVGINPEIRVVLHWSIVPGTWNVS